VSYPTFLYQETGTQKVQGEITEVLIGQNGKKMSLCDFVNTDTGKVPS